MTSLSQLKILESRALLGQFLCLLASLSQSKIVRAKYPKNVFSFRFLGSGGYPHVKSAVCEKRPGATRTKSHDFGAILGSLGGSLGALF